MNNGNTKVWFWLGDMAWLSVRFDQYSPRISKDQQYQLFGTAQLKEVYPDENTDYWHASGEFFPSLLEVGKIILIGQQHYEIVKMFPNKKCRYVYQ